MSRGLLWKNVWKEGLILRTVILGKEIKNTYDVDCKKKEIKNENGESSIVFYGKPELI